MIALKKQYKLTQLARAELLNYCGTLKPEDLQKEIAVFNNGEEIKTGTVIWAAGITGNTIEGLPDNTIVRGNRIHVDRYNRVLGCVDVFAIGDIAYMETPKYPQAHPQQRRESISQNMGRYGRIPQ